MRKLTAAHMRQVRTGLALGRELATRKPEAEVLRFLMFAPLPPRLAIAARRAALDTYFLLKDIP